VVIGRFPPRLYEPHPSNEGFVSFSVLSPSDEGFRRRPAGIGSLAKQRSRSTHRLTVRRTIGPLPGEGTEELDESPGRYSSRPGGRQTSRLVRDLIALGLLDAQRPTAAERLDAQLGHELVAAIRTELTRSNAGGSPFQSRPGRVA
jgi:hypothetical protein